MTRRIAKPSREAQVATLATGRRTASDRLADTLLTMAIIIALLAAAGTAHGQSLRGIRLGERLPDVTARFAPVDAAAGTAGDLLYYSMELDTGTTVRITGHGDDLLICYIEVIWGGDERDADLAAPGYRFGETTRAEIRRRHGSNGFIYRGGPGPYFEDGLVLNYNSYDLVGGEAVAVMLCGFPITAWGDDSETQDRAVANATLQGVTVMARDYAEWMYGPDRMSDDPCPVVWVAKW
jgi:hypothetical protein